MFSVLSGGTTIKVRRFFPFCAITAISIVVPISAIIIKFYLSIIFSQFFDYLLITLYFRFIYGEIKEGNTYPFWISLVQKNQNCQLKLKFGSYID